MTLSDAIAQLEPYVEAAGRPLLAMLVELTRAQELQLAKQAEQIAELERRMEGFVRKTFARTNEKNETAKQDAANRMQTDDVEELATKLAQQRETARAEELRLAAELRAAEAPLDGVGQVQTSTGGSVTYADRVRARRILGRHKSDKKREQHRRELAALVKETVVVPVKPEHLPEGMTMEDFEVFGNSMVLHRVEYVRGHLRQVRFEFPKLQSRRDPSLIVQAPVPATPVAGGKYAASVYAAVVVMRVLLAMPLHRVAQAWKRDGYPVAPSVLGDLYHRAAYLLRPIYDRILTRVRESDYIHADETPQPMLAPGKGKVARGWMWVALSTSAIAYLFHVSRSAEAARQLLGDTVRNLMVDGYSGYNQSAIEGGRSGCWTHARRDFVPLRPTWDVARQILDLITELYILEIRAVEEEISLEALARVRDKQSRPIVERIFELANTHQKEFAPNSVPYAALGYIINHPAELRRFLGDPNIPLDNNIAERALRIVAQGRKSSLFVGPGDNGTSLAILLSVARTCALYGVDLHNYLNDVLPRLARRLDDQRGTEAVTAAHDAMTPWAWAAAREISKAA